MRDPITSSGIHTAVVSCPKCHNRVSVSVNSEHKKFGDAGAAAVWNEIAKSKMTVVGTGEVDLGYLGKGEETPSEWGHCVRCKKPVATHNLTHGSGAYFFDYYCSGCWEKFREEHSRICGKCGVPQYRCCC